MTLINRVSNIPVVTFTFRVTTVTNITIDFLVTMMTLINIFEYSCGYLYFQGYHGYQH
jgi:hypothetical protein